jgi:hypothetical protein
MKKSISIFNVGKKLMFWLNLLKKMKVVFIQLDGVVILVGFLLLFLMMVEFYSIMFLKILNLILFLK